MPRFFVDPAAVGETHIRLDPETLSHIRVLRLGPAETFTVTDGTGIDYRCIFSDSQAQIIDRAINQAEPTIQCAVYLAFTRGERMDFAIQKSVELGASEICLFPARRCVVQHDEKGLLKKLPRWGKIALEAAKQSGRGNIPPVTAASDFSSAMVQAAKVDQAFFFYENETQQSLRQALDQRPDFQTASLVIGPEGGFTEEEASLALTHGLRSVSLGPRILRAETAPAAALAAVMFYTGNL